jgi:hypothetical protein
LVEWRYRLLLAYSILKSPLPDAPAAADAPESPPFSPSLPPASPPAAAAAAGAGLFLSRNFLILGWSVGLPSAPRRGVSVNKLFFIEF